MTIETTTNAHAHVELEHLDHLTDKMAEKIKAGLDEKVSAEMGKQLMTEEESEKLAGVAEGAQVNVLETIKLNGVPLEATGKSVDINLSEYAKAADLATVLTYKGTVNSYAELPSEKQKVGDVYNVAASDAEHNINAGDNVAWDGESWDVLAGTVDLSGKVDKEEGKGLSTENFTTELKEKLESIESATDEDMDKLAAKFDF